MIFLVIELDQTVFSKIVLETVFTLEIKNRDVDKISVNIIIINFT